MEIGYGDAGFLVVHHLSCKVESKLAVLDRIQIRFCVSTSELVKGDLYENPYNRVMDWEEVFTHTPNCINGIRSND